MIGTTVGSYRIVEKLSQGGMGAVYTAEHTLIGRVAAVKVLLPEFTRREALRRRFLTEAKAAAAITHPGVVQILDFGYRDDGRAYLIMEYLEGEPLSRRLERQRRLPLAVTPRELPVEPAARPAWLASARRGLSWAALAAAASFAVAAVTLGPDDRAERADRAANPSPATDCFVYPERSFGRSSECFRVADTCLGRMVIAQGQMPKRIRSLRCVPQRQAYCYRVTDSIEESAVWQCRRESAECEHEQTQMRKMHAPHVVIGPCETKT